MALFSRDATAYSPGDEIGGRYKLTGVLGRGGFGAVYAGEHSGTHQKVAVKMLAVHGIDAGEASERFYREARITAGLTHPNTVRVFDVGQAENGPLYLVMEMLRGPTLEQILTSLDAKNLGMSETQAISLISPVLDSLAEAHAAGLVHRDMKPANIMLHDVSGSEPVVKVLDFGCSHTSDSDLTAEGQVMGTPGYMSPEQCRGDIVGHASDLYSVAVILYRCVAGVLPFDSAQPLQLIYMHANEPVPDARERADRHVSQAMADVLNKALAKRADARYSSARDMRAALERIRGRVNNAPVNLHGQTRTHISGSPADAARQLVSLMALAVDGYRAPEAPPSEPNRRSAPASGEPTVAYGQGAARAGSELPDGGQVSATGQTAGDGGATILRAPAEPWHQDSAASRPAQTVHRAGPVQPVGQGKIALIAGVVAACAVLIGLLIGRGHGGDSTAADANPEPGAAAAPLPTDDPPATVPAQNKQAVATAAQQAQQHIGLARGASSLAVRVEHLVEAVRLMPDNAAYKTALEHARAQLAAAAAKPSTPAPAPAAVKKATAHKRAPAAHKPRRAAPPPQQPARIAPAVLQE